MKLCGTRFGDLEFEEDHLIQINEGLLGFPLSRRFLMFPYDEQSAFFWLQSADESDIAIIVVNPFDFFADLEFSIQDEDASSIGLDRGEDVEIFSLVTIPEGNPGAMRTNLAGPVVVNAANRQGKQILVKEYSPRQPLIPQEMRSQVIRKGNMQRQRSQRRRAAS